MSSELIIAIISAIAAVVAAVVTAVIGANSTRKTGTIDAQSQQLRDLENRNATRKYEIYKPILDLYSMLLSPHGSEAKRWKENHKDVDIEKTLDDFAKWVIIYGSDDVVLKFHNFSETLNSLHGREKDIWVFLPLLYRLYAEFIIAVRRDMGYPDTKIGVNHILATGGFNFYGSHLWPTSCLPLKELYEKYRKEYNWRPRWEDPLLLNKSDTSKEAISSRPETSPQVDQELLVKLEKLLKEQSSQDNGIVRGDISSSQSLWNTEETKKDGLRDRGSA